MSRANEMKSEKNKQKEHLEREVRVMHYRILSLRSIMPMTVYLTQYHYSANTLHVD